MGNWLFELDAPENSPKKITDSNIQWAILERLDAIAEHLLAKGTDVEEAHSQLSATQESE